MNKSEIRKKILKIRQKNNLRNYSINFKFIDLHLHSDLIPAARDEAVNLLKNQNQQNKVNTLLSIFENNDAIKLLKGG